MTSDIDHDSSRDNDPLDNEPIEDTDIDEEGDDAGSFAGSEVSPSGGVDADIGDRPDPHAERKLDKALKESFDCSDPVSINPGAD